MVAYRFPGERDPTRSPAANPLRSGDRAFSHRIHIPADPLAEEGGSNETDYQLSSSTHRSIENG